MIGHKEIPFACMRERFAEVDKATVTSDYLATRIRIGAEAETIFLPGVLSTKRMTLSQHSLPSYSTGML